MNVKLTLLSPAVIFDIFGKAGAPAGITDMAFDTAPPVGHLSLIAAICIEYMVAFFTCNVLSCEPPTVLEAPTRPLSHARLPSLNVSVRHRCAHRIGLELDRDLLHSAYIKADVFTPVSQA